LNRINTYFVVLLSLAASFLTPFLYFREHRKKEPKSIDVPVRIEVYRTDRHPLPGADIYLNQKFIGKTDEKGFFSRAMNLLTGESYTLHVERESGGFVYGPWETHFRVDEQKKEQKKKGPEPVPVPSLEGESDITSELDRAQSGKASVYDKYHFLALLEGYMYYTIRVRGGGDEPVPEATVIINGKAEGRTDPGGILTVRYSGDAERKERIQVIKTGKHIWNSEEQVKPDAVVDVALNKMLLVDFYALTENYGVLGGVENALVFVDTRYIGKTDREGAFSFSYRSELGVDGNFSMVVQFPQPYMPEVVNRTYLIMEGLPRLTVTDFAYPRQAVQPKIAVLPFNLKKGPSQKGQQNLSLEKQASVLKSRLEDYLAADGAYALASSDAIKNLFRQFNIDVTKSQVQWREIPLIKKEVDAVVYGDVGGSGGELDVHIVGIDYTGEVFFEVERRASPRELLSLSEDIFDGIRSNFAIEGNVLSVAKKLYLNLGRAQGVGLDNRFNGFSDFYDESRKSYSKKRVVRLKIIEAGEFLSVAEVETITEGYLLDEGVKVKRLKETGPGGRTLSVSVNVVSNGRPVQDANVYADDQWAGQTDGEGSLVLNVPFGASVELLAYKEGYLPGKVTSRIADDTGSISIELRQGETLLTIDSDPQGAVVFVDGAFKGTTPIVQEAVAVSYGFHRLELELDGHLRFSEYRNFSEPKVSLVKKDRVVLFPDYLKIADQRYADHNIYGALSVLQGIPQHHPDYVRALEMAGYISLRNLEDYSGAIQYYTRAIEQYKVRQNGSENLLTYYNAGQAHLGEAERLFYDDGDKALFHYAKAVSYFAYIRDRKNRLPSQDRSFVYQNALYSIGVCYQKLYYITESEEYVTRARYAWTDYFDFFDRALLESEFFKRQHAAAQSYKEEAERLSGEP
jgi:hypothetical protein